jgi:small conductance mechanosensitive channel
MVMVWEFADSGINIAVRPWSNVSEFGPAAAEVKLAIVDAFRAAKVEIPFPQREIRILDGKTLA